MTEEQVLPTTTPPWPSLYDIAVEFIPVQHTSPIQSRGHYLIHPGDVFRFTFYWSLIFYVPAFVLCGTYAFLNLLVPPSLDRPSSTSASLESYPLSPQDRATPTRPKRVNERRSRLTFSLLVLFGFLVLGFTGAAMSSALVGYILVGVFKSGGFFISTWIPCIWALIHTTVGFLGMWPSVIDII